jgi:hypothetical protein
LLILPFFFVCVGIYFLAVRTGAAQTLKQQWGIAPDAKDERENAQQNTNK